MQWAGDRKGRPYESVTRGAVRGRNPPVTASPCQPPLGKGAIKDGGMRIATGALRPRNDGSRKNLRVIPRPVRRLVVGIRNTPAQRTRRTDCHTSDIGHWFAMTHYKKCGISPGGTMWASSPTECLPIEFRRGRRPRRPASVTRSVVRRADVGIGPYGSATRGAVGGRPQGSPLRRGYKGCGETGRCGHRPLRMG